ncbi:MAG: OmpA family protein [candidate division WOR-3 bacterium]
MQKKLFVMVTALLLAGLTYADPALGGGRGLFRIQDARVEEDGALVFANRWSVQRLSSDMEGTSYRGPLFGLEMNYAPFPFVEMFGSLVGVANLNADQWSLFYDWQGQALGAKLSIPWIPVLKLGASGHWMMEKENYEYKSSTGFLDGIYPSGKSWRALGALRLWELYKTLPTLMFNYGRGYQSDYAFVGAGIEFPSDALDLFVEASSEIVDPAPSFDKFFGKDYTPRARIAPGVRIRIPYFHLNGGVEIGLTDSVPDYQAILGFSIVSPFPKPPPKPFGRLAGQVKDARTGMPVAATITSPNRRFGRMKADADGIFFLQRAPVGVVVVKAEAEGYIPEAVPLVVSDKGFATHTFELRPLVPYGIVAGRVYDKVTGQPLEAKIGFSGVEVAAAASNPSTGFFRIDNVPAGLVSVTVEKDGYFPEERVLDVEDGAVTKLEAALVARDMRGWFVARVVDMKTGGALAASISFTNVKRTALGADAQTGEASTELPVGAYEVKVEAEGYLPQTSAFTVAKSDTVRRTFEMVSKGMVMTLKGVYFEFGKATLRTESYPALMEAAQVMKDNPDILVEIQGHTDNIGSDAANQTLSEKRAYSVMNWLVQYGGIDPKRITAKGFGESQPIASNSTDEGRQLNRRVDFAIKQ